MQQNRWTDLPGSGTESARRSDRVGPQRYLGGAFDIVDTARVAHPESKIAEHAVRQGRLVTKAELFSQVKRLDPRSVGIVPVPGHAGYT